MAEDPAELDLRKARDLDLLSFGLFSDVDVVCHDRAWKCHRAILASRSVWFGKALVGPFEEATTRRVKLDRQDPASVDLALKHIYGGGLDVESSVSANNFVVKCVSLYSTASFLDLTKLRSSVEKAVRSYCDERMKQLCTTGSEVAWYQGEHEDELSPWALDTILGVRASYHCSCGPLRAVLMEFMWIGRFRTLLACIAPTVLGHFKDTPDFMEDLISWYATGLWLQEPVWAAYGNTELDDYYNTKPLICARCGKDISHQTDEERKGEVDNPFTLEGKTKHEAGWCRDCGRLDMIPWRSQEANDG